jgi:hypothetical protein
MKWIGAILIVGGLGIASVLLYLHFDGLSKARAVAQKKAVYQRSVAEHRQRLDALRKRTKRGVEAADRVANACRVALARRSSKGALAILSYAERSANLSRAKRAVVTLCNRSSAVVLFGKRWIVQRELRRLAGRVRRVRKVDKNTRQWNFRSGAHAVFYFRASADLIEKGVVQPLRSEKLPRRVSPPRAPAKRVFPVNRRQSYDVAAYVVCGTFLPAGILLLFLARRPTRAELAAIFETSSQLRRDADAALARLEHSDASGDFGARLSKLQADIAAAVQQQRCQIAPRAKEENSPGFVVAAVKAVMPRDQWRYEFRQRASSATERVIDGHQLMRTIADTTAREAAAYRDSIAPSTAITLSEKGRRGLQQLTERNDRLARFVDNDPALTSIMHQRAQLKDDLATGGLVMATGVAVALFPQELGFELAGEIAGNFLGEIIENELICDKMVEALGELLVEQVGEEALGEIVEALGLALTGIGAIWTAYKLVKYGALVKRLHTSVGEQLSARANDTLEKISATATYRANHAMHSTRTTLAQHLTQLRITAAQREVWAQQRLS